MTTIMPEQKRIKDALKWLGEQDQETQEIGRLIAEAGFKFNLTPKEEEYLLHIFKKQAEYTGPGSQE